MFVRCKLEGIVPGTVITYMPGATEHREVLLVVAVDHWRDNRNYGKLFFIDEDGRVCEFGASGDTFTRIIE